MKTYLNITALFLFTLILTGCSHKIDVDTIKSNEVKIESKSKSIYVDLKNSTDENIHLLYDIKQGLENLGYELTKEQKEASLLLEIQIVFAAPIDKNSSTKDILKNIHFNIGLGSSSGNFSIYTKIGATLGKILSNSLDSTMYQVVVDINLIEQKNKNSAHNQQLIATAPMDGEEKQKVIYMIEESLTESILQIFQ